MRSFDSITFDTEKFRYHGEEDDARIWVTEADFIFLHYFPIPPDINASLKNIDDIRVRYRELTLKGSSAIIEVDTITIDGCDAVRTILKTPKEPHGVIYVGTITLPFRDFSYVIRIQSEEFGITGLRESEILNEFLATGEVSLDIKPGEEFGEITGWSADPYDPTIYMPYQRNRAEAEEYDERFPDNPLTRVRSLLKHIEKTLHVSDEVKQEPKYVYEIEAGRKKSWWKIW